MEERVMRGWENGVQRKGRRTHATKQPNKKQIMSEKAQVAEHQNSRFHAGPHTHRVRRTKLYAAGVAGVLVYYRK